MKKIKQIDIPKGMSNWQILSDKPVYLANNYDEASPLTRSLVSTNDTTAKPWHLNVAIKR